MQARAQAPAAKPARATTGSLSAGLTLTSGNKDTSTANAGFEIVHDPKTRNLVKVSGLVISGSSGGQETAEQFGLIARDEYTFSKRAFAYGDVRYLRDRFKGITYLLSPTAGLGYRVVDTPDTTLALSAGAGGVWEKDPGVALHTSGAVTANEKLSKSAAVTQKLSALWKTGDFSDALYTFGIALSTTVVSQAQVKVELLDTFKNKPPTADIRKNDVSTLVSVLYKF